MSLSKPIAREPVHRRRVECFGYRREDGLWDVEGHLIDTKGYDFSNFDRGTIRAGEPVHEMWLRLTLDDDLVIHRAEACTEFAPFGVCPEAAPNMERLAGVKIGPGWRKTVKRRIGGILGCTHLRELLGPIATTAYQTILPIRRRERHRERPSSALINSCLAYADGGAVARRLWPEHGSTEG